MKKFLFSCAVAFGLTGAVAADKPAPIATAGVIALIQDGHVAGFILVATNGQYVALSEDECGQSAECVKEVVKALADKRTSKVALNSHCGEKQGL